MTQPPPLLRDQLKIDADHLKLLSVFHFVAAGFSLVGILFLAGHYAVFRVFLSNPGMWPGPKQNLPPAQFFALFKWFYVICAIWFLCSGILCVCSGFFIRSRKHRMFSLVVSGINCAHVPIGTLLGVFTIIVLIRNSVREEYETRNRP